MTLYATMLIITNVCKTPKSPVCCIFFSLMYGGDNYKLNDLLMARKCLVIINVILI